ncbi:MAG: holo-ACP synthase [Clostridiales bacterium]|jgi:holo-[acyl-carrier protein] synthase|nr:holo-ACP synthase [Clostridiales bacterium]
MIYGVGTDIIEIERVANAIKNPRFISRVYSKEEQSYCAVKSPQTYAGLFAAKEAAVKSIGIGLGRFQLNEVEILHDASGKPMVNPRGAFAILCSENRWGFFISISHCKTTAAATAVAVISDMPE